MGLAKALVRLRISADFSELLLLAHAIKTNVDYMSTSTKCTYVLNASSKGETNSSEIWFKNVYVLLNHVMSRLKLTLTYLGNCVNKATCQTGGNNVFSLVAAVGKRTKHPPTD